MSVVAAMAIGLTGGMIAGLAGVGGGILFVPALVIFLDLSQLHAEATSLVAIVPVAVVGTWRQHRYGNVRLQDGLLIGVLSVGGVAAGAIVANSVSQRALEIGFAMVALLVAARLAAKALRPPPAGAGGVRRGSALEMD